MTEHTPDRPSWDCRACLALWPCPPARVRLSAELDSITLAMYAWACLEEAAGDLADATPSQLYERFLHWTRQPSRPGTPPPWASRPGTVRRRRER